MLRRLLFLFAILSLMQVACGDDEETPAATPAASEAASFDASDGVTLRGHLFGEGDTLVILAHMRPSDQSSWYGFAAELAEKGYSALTFDFRGYGESEGEKELSKIDLDVEAAVKAMRAEGYERIYLVGASMGGTASLIVAAREDVAGVVTVSAPAKFEGLDAETAVSEVTEPKLFIASEGDASAFSSLETLFEPAPDPKEQKVFEGSAHGTKLLGGDKAAELKAAIVAFLSE